MSQIIPPDLMNERRLTALETQMLEVFKMFGEIRGGFTRMEDNFTSFRNSTTGTSSEIKEMKDDISELKKGQEALGTLAFLTKNPKMALLIAIGGAFLISPELRAVVARVLLGHS